MKEKIFMIIFLLVLGTVLTGILSGVNYYTAPLIERNREIKIMSGVLDSFGMAHSKEEAEKVFSENVRAEQKDSRTFYISREDDIAFEFAGSGLWGPVHGVIALYPDLQTIKGLTIIHQEETPGLGGRIAEKAFLDEFNNKKIVPELKILPPGKAHRENEVDGITGATLSCQALEKILNGQLKTNLSLWEEGRQ